MVEINNFRNFRQLLAGVENLRMIASSLDQLDTAYGPSTTDPYLSESDDDYNEGPAL